MANYPKTLERDYRRALRRRVANVERAVSYAFEQWLDLGARDEIDERARTDSISSNVDQVTRMIRRVRTAYDATYTTAKDLDLASETFQRVDGYTYRGIKREYTAAVGVEPLINSDTRRLASVFVTENVALIKDLPAKQLAQIEADVIEAIENGERAGAISKAIRERSGMARRRADLIARDQMGKVVSQLNQKRQQDLGIDKYIWRTVGDERVRPEHDERDGVGFSWSDPPEDGHPGEPINCRCQAEPVLTGILDELGIDYDEDDFSQPSPPEPIRGAKDTASAFETIVESTDVFGGARSPQELYDSTHPTTRIRPQEKEFSCGVACVRQVLEDAGVDISEAQLRESANYEFFAKISKGLTPEQLGGMLETHGVSAKAGYAFIDDPAKAVIEAPKPFLALVENHWVIVDSHENDIIITRDPWGTEGPGSDVGIQGHLSVSKFIESWTRGSFGIVQW